MEHSSFVYVIHIRTTQEKLWDALTLPEFTTKYWVELKPECSWEKGAPWKLILPDGRVADSGEVLEVDKPNRLVLRWRNEFIPAMAADGDSRCTITLVPEGDSVRLTLLHEIDKAESVLIHGVSNGWPKILSSLKSLLETGDALEATKRWPKGM
jgi:uncharacterized protein YndB with AHSA1/START domain